MEVASVSPTGPDPARGALSSVSDFMESVVWAVVRAAEYLLSGLTDPIIGWSAENGAKVDVTTVYIFIGSVTVLLSLVLGRRFPIGLAGLVLCTAAWQSFQG